MLDIYYDLVRETLRANGVKGDIVEIDDNDPPTVTMSTGKKFVVRTEEMSVRRVDNAD